METYHSLTYLVRNVQYRHSIPAPANRTFGSTWLYKNKPSASMTQVACESKLRSIVRSSMHDLSVHCKSYRLPFRLPPVFSKLFAHLNLCIYPPIRQNCTLARFPLYLDTAPTALLQIHCSASEKSLTFFSTSQIKCCLLFVPHTNIKHEILNIFMYYGCSHQEIQRIFHNMYISEEMVLVVCVFN